MRHFTFAGVPANSTGRAGGVAFAPEALRDLGLCSAISAVDAGDLDTAIQGARRDPDSGLVALDGVIEATLILRRRVCQLIEQGRTPFLCGGCSAIAAGAFAGFCDGVGRADRPGLAYVSGQLDLHDGDTSADGKAADMTVSTLLGRGPRAWGILLGDGPLLKPDNTALVGFRDAGEAQQTGAIAPEDFQPHVLTYNIDRIRDVGALEAGRAVEARLKGAPGRFWLHIDMSVMDEEAFPATDDLSPGGLDWDETANLLRPLAASSALLGMSLSGYDPEKDEGASCGLHLVDLFRSICQ